MKKLRIRDVNDAISQGIVLIPEDRRRQGLTTILSIRHNIGLVSYKHIFHSRWIKHRELKKLVEKMCRRLTIKAPSIDTPVEMLSGGNQQKTVLGKWLSIHPKILILDEPTRGIDVGTKYEIYKLIHEMCNNGVSILLIDSDLEELMGMSDRVLVVCKGAIAGEVKKQEINANQIMHLAVGGERGMSNQTLARDHKSKFSFVKFYNKVGIFFILVILIIICSVLSPVFLSKANLLNLLTQTAVVSIIACGITLLVITGNTDLSAGSVVAFVGCVVLGTYKNLTEAAGVAPFMAGVLAVGAGHIAEHCAVQRGCGDHHTVQRPGLHCYAGNFHLRARYGADVHQREGHQVRRQDRQPRAGQTVWADTLPCGVHGTHRHCFLASADPNADGPLSVRHRRQSGIRQSRRHQNGPNHYTGLCRPCDLR